MMAEPLSGVASGYTIGTIYNIDASNSIPANARLVEGDAGSGPRRLEGDAGSGIRETEGT